MAGVELLWMQTRLELKPDLVKLLMKTEYDCYDTFLDLQNTEDIQKLFEEAKETSNEWSSLFNSDMTNFSPPTLRKLSKIPLVAKNMGENFFMALKSNTTKDTEEKNYENATIIAEYNTETIEETIEYPRSSTSSKPFQTSRHQFDPKHIDVDAFTIRLKNCLERTYQTVIDMHFSQDVLEVSIALGDNYTIIPTHNCMICRKEMRISYDTKDGKLKQFYTGNMKKHLVKRHVGNVPNEFVNTNRITKKRKIEPSTSESE